MNWETENEMEDDLRREYDFSPMQDGIRGKYVEPILSRHKLSAANARIYRIQNNRQNREIKKAIVNNLHQKPCKN